MNRKHLGLALVIALVLAQGAVAAARPGGGETYSGGGGHGGSSSGGGGDGAVIFELIYWLFRLIFAYPVIGLPLLAIAIGYVVVQAYRGRQSRDWDRGPTVPLRATAAADDLTGLRRRDPDFSRTAFEDFAFRLFAAAHRARHSPQALATIAPYVSAAARDALAKRAPTHTPIEQVAIGAMRTYRVALPGADDGRVLLSLELEANLATAAQTEFSVERWHLSRAATAKSKPPQPGQIHSCPNCGAPWQAKDTGTQVCAYCGEAVDNGRFAWIVDAIEQVSSEQRPPTLTTEVPERGTDLPTYRQPRVDAAWQRLTQDDPALDLLLVEARIAMIYARLNAAWSANDLEPARGLVSDGLFDYLQYWVAAYRAQGLRNVLADMRITHTELARLERDRYYDAVTVRIWATGKDYVVREATGERVRGSPRRDRAYSEYWTLIRGASTRGAPATQPVCGHCHAPLQIAQSGACEHCGAHVTSGEHDWVVSKIEQDDSYRG